MKWSWKLGEFSGIGVYVHATFLLILGWVAWTHWKQEQSVSAAAWGVAFILALFGCVVLHEFGHALTARKYGIKTRDITLLPIGGMARLERMPDEPRQELWVALAGPAVNVVIASTLFIWLVVTNTLVPLGGLGVATGSFVGRLLVVNLFLAAFNLLPAFPMDGGRVVRALLAMKMDYAKATKIAASLGQAMALLFGFIGLLVNPFLIFIAFFVWIGATQESSMAQIKTALSGLPVSHAMVTDFRVLHPHDPLDRAIELILAGSQQDFPVVQEERVVGVLTRSDLLAALAKRGRGASVAEVMRRDFRVVDSHEMLDTAFAGLQACGCRTLPVTRGGRLVGLVTMDNVGEFMAIQSALAGSQRRDG